MTEGFTEPSRGECPAEFGTEYHGESDTGYPDTEHANPDYSPATTGHNDDSAVAHAVDHAVDHGFGWLGGPVGPAGLDDQPKHRTNDLDEFADPAAMVRPYAWTRGRTRANYDLKLETLISTTDQGQDETRLLQLEHRSVTALCRYPLSVAEVAAKLSVPLGVARVVLSDMAELGLISIHRTFADDDIAAHLVLMERVLSGLRRL
jgi:hypothetical protein